MCQILNVQLQGQRVNVLLQGFLEGSPQFEWILLTKTQYSFTPVLSRFSFLAILLRKLLFYKKKWQQFKEGFTEFEYVFVQILRVVTKISSNFNNCSERGREEDGVPQKLWHNVRGPWYHKVS